MSDMITCTLLLLTSILGFRLALEALTEATRGRVRAWKKVRHGHYWTYVSDPVQHGTFQHFSAPVARHEAFVLAVLFVAALVGIISGAFTFWDSNIRYQELLIVKQGTLLTYGPSNPKRWALDELDENAGAQFVVGTWLKTEEVVVGYR